MLIAVRPPEAGWIKDGVPDYTLNRNSTMSPSSPAEYIPRGPRIEKQPVEVNSTGWQGFAGKTPARRRGAAPPLAGFMKDGVPDYTLNRNSTMSPSFMTYSLPSERTRPFSLAAFMEPQAIRSSKLTTSARMKPRSKSVWILPAAWGPWCPV